ncbi:Uncharacterised protein [Legionella beliardensis]|uniref:Uncharacterized protein n=1 Tax=Legionella beliardensis TaxID=91822 RepID=A0A378IC95_9GAMM|nr:hypothetical protein [Legionella beliardensis]STX29924.1 Uncharacterised protein [Legionella beliardensis]
MVETKDALNKEVFNYKCWFTTIVLLLAYTYMHIMLTGIYFEVLLDSWMNFTAPLPFAQRQFVPFLARSLKKIVSLQTDEIFIILEFVFVILTFFTLKKLLELEFNKKVALLLSWLFFLLLPLYTVINYRFTYGGVAAIFYPYDTSTLFFMFLGFYLCLKRQWFWLTVCIFFATLNRESSILLVLLIPALHFRSWKQTPNLLLPFLSSLFAYILARLWTFFLTMNLPRSYIQWYIYNTSKTNFSRNMQWLIADQNILMFVFAFAGITLFWFLFYDYIPLKYRSIRYITFAYFLGLLGAGLVAETRIFAEIITLMYLPVCLAISGWLTNQYVIEQQNRGLLYFLNRYIIFLVIVLVVIAHNLIDSKIKQFIPVPAWNLSS